MAHRSTNNFVDVYRHVDAHVHGLYTIVMAYAIIAHAIIVQAITAYAITA